MSNNNFTTTSKIASAFDLDFNPEPSYVCEEGAVYLFEDEEEDEVSSYEEEFED